MFKLGWGTFPFSTIFGTPPPKGDSTLPEGYVGTGWNHIHGELLTFPNPAQDLPPIDHLEGFQPKRRSLYHRVLILCTSTESPRSFTSTWIHTGSSNLVRQGILISIGSWDTYL